MARMVTTPRLLLGIVVVVLLNLVLIGHSVGAIGKNYFDNNDIDGAGKEISGSVGKTPYVQQSSLYLKVYFESPSGGKINIQDYGFCPGSSNYEDSGSSPGENVTYYLVRSVNNGPKEVIGKRFQDCRGTKTINVSFNRNDQDKATGYYIAELYVTHLGSGGSNAQNTFRVTTDGKYVTHATRGRGNGSEVTVEQTNTAGTNINYNIKFGADCKVTEPGKYRIELFDLDNNGGSGAQLHRKVTLRLKANNQPRAFKVSTESNPDKVSLAGSVKSAQPSGDNRTVYLYFTAKPEEKFNLIMEGVYYNNTIQYNLPFDGIYYERAPVCWEVEPTTYIKKSTQSSWKTRDISVKPGQTVDFRQVAENIGATTASTDSVVMKKWSNQVIPDSELEERWPGSQRPRAPQESGYSDWRNININNLAPNSKQVKSYMPNSFTIPQDVRYTGTEHYTVTVTKTRIVTDPETGEDVVETYQEEEDRTRAVARYWNPPEGTRYCVKYRIDPAKRDRKNGAFGRNTTGELCAVVRDSPEEFELTPTVSIDKKVYSYYPNINVTGRINATPGTSSVSGSHTWEMYAVRYREKPESLTMRDNETGPNANPCRELPAGDRLGGCELFSTNGLPPYERTVLYTNGGPDELGSALCFFVRVQSPNESMDGQWRLSNLDCAISGVNPRIQVWGGDARVTGDIETVVKTMSGKQIGSWGEYGVFSNGTNYNMASGAGLNGAPASRSVQDWNAMTFANHTSTYGRFAGDLAAPTVSTDGASTFSNITIDSVDDIIDLDGADSIRGNDIRGVVNVTGTLRISSDLRYPALVDSLRKIPRVILVADDIVIESDVTEIDPWIVARNRISTCGDNLDTPENDGISGFLSFSSARLLSSTLCSTRLQFNGPVIAPKIYLYRTHDKADGSPAEIFNLRASNYLSSYVGTGIDDPIASTDSVREISPRF